MRLFLFDLSKKQQDSTFEFPETARRCEELLRSLVHQRAAKK